MRTNEFNKIYEEYEKITDNDAFNNISVFGYSSMTRKQMDKFATLMITKGCAIRQNRLNDFYVYNNQGIGIKISHEALLTVING